MRIRSLALLSLLALTACGERLPPLPEGPEPPMVVPLPEELTLYSLDPDDSPPKDAELFNGYRVLGKVVITDPEERRVVVMAVNRGIAEKSDQFLCFEPRHGLRIVSNNKTIDYVICFQCGMYHEHLGKKFHSGSISPLPQPFLNAVLKRAGAPLNPKKAT